MLFCSWVGGIRDPHEAKWGGGEDAEILGYMKSGMLEGSIYEPGSLLGMDRAVLEVKDLWKSRASFEGTLDMMT
jgi:hypothetical protein